MRLKLLSGLENKLWIVAVVLFLFPVLTEPCNTSVSAESASPTKSVIWPLEFNLMYPLKINGKWVVKPWVEEDRKEKT